MGRMEKSSKLKILMNCLQLLRSTVFITGVIVNLYVLLTYCQTPRYVSSSAADHPVKTHQWRWSNNKICTWNTWNHLRTKQLHIFQLELLVVSATIDQTGSRCWRNRRVVGLNATHTSLACDSAPALLLLLLLPGRTARSHALRPPCGAADSRWSVHDRLARKSKWLSARVSAPVIAGLRHVWQIRSNGSLVSARRGAARLRNSAKTHTRLFSPLLTASSKNTLFYCPAKATV